MNRAHSMGALALAWAATMPGAQAQVFKLSCSVEGQFPDAKVPAARLSVELQTIGRNLFFHVKGPAPYEMTVSTLVTEEFRGENLTSATQMGARRQQRSSLRESEILIERRNMALSAHHDLNQAGKTRRLSYSGKCRPA